MTRARPVEAVLAGVATLAVTVPLTGLFSPTGAWLRPSIVLVLLTVLSGIALRSVVPLRPVVIALQALVLLEAAALLHGRGHLAGGLVPTTETAQAVGILLGDAYRVVTTFSAPAPTERGAVVAISLLVALTALAVDAVAVTYRAPAAAGVPLLTAFLSSATNTSEGLSAWMVVPPALAWLALVARQGLVSLRTWGGAADTGNGRDPVAGFATLGRVVGVLALAAAVLVPALIPHLPTTFVADGLARGTGDGGRGGPLRLSTSIDIARDLGSRSDEPVVVYRTSASNPEPLRVGILDEYRDGQWRVDTDVTYVPLDGQLPGSPAAAGVERASELLEVSRSAIGLPQVALPANAVGTPFPTGSWHVTGAGLVELTAPVSEYTVEYEALTPTPEQFGTFVDLDGRGDLRVDPRAENTVRALVDQVTEEADADSPYEVAVAIQDHLRSPDYTYSEELVDETADGRRSEEPLVRFLQTRRGYCVQFTSAMIMMSRAAGIPARMAVGFLPGSVDGEERVVRADDAHAWPELYFPDLGWMRFEPTPGVRSGIAPQYTRETSAATNSALPVPTPSAASTPGVPNRPEGDVTAQDPLGVDTTPTTGVLDVVTRQWPTVLGVLALLGLAALTPLGAWLSRRRAQRRARDDAERVEAEWQSLLLRLGDVGLVPGEGATPRQASRELRTAAYLSPDEGAALERFVDVLEQARYARPGSPLAAVDGDARTVWRAALGRRRRRDRVRALLLPEEGRRHWVSLVPGRGGRDDDADAAEDGSGGGAGQSR